MLTKQESIVLKDYLALAPEPDITFTHQELQGYLFGLAITPGPLLPRDWVPVIFGDQPPLPDPLGQVEEMRTCLIQVYTTLRATFQEDTLPFPFAMGELGPEQIDDLYSWVSGFEEALALSEQLWDPEGYDDIPEHITEELYHSIMTVQGLVDSAEVMELFEDMPEEKFQEVFPGRGVLYEDREVQVQTFLLASLPLAVETLQNHAKLIEKLLSEKEREGKRAKKSADRKPGKAKIIPVDFGQKK